MKLAKVLITKELSDRLIAGKTVIVSIPKDATGTLPLLEPQPQCLLLAPCGSGCELPLLRGVDDRYYPDQG